MKDVLYTWVCSYLHVIVILFFSPPISTRFCKEEEKEWINRGLLLRFALFCSLNWTKVYLPITGAIHPLILMTEQRKDFIMYRLHIQDRHHLRALINDCNALKHLKDTPYRQTLRKFDQNALLFLCWLALLIRYCLTCLLHCLTPLALRNTVNHECEPHYHHHRNYPAFLLQPIVGAKNMGSFMNRKTLSACCCLSPYRACGVVGAEPHTYKP